MPKLSITIGVKELTWLKKKVASGDFSSLSHGIRKCVLKAIKDEEATK